MAITRAHGRYTRRLTPTFLGEVAPRGDVLERILLYDFVTGESNLLPQHREGLTRYIVPCLTPSAPPCGVWIGGMASRRGSEGLNRALGWARTLEVEGYLRSSRASVGRLASRHSLTTTWHGEAYSTHHTENSEWYRAVLVVVQRLAAPNPPRRASRGSQSPVFSRFRIRMVGLGFEGGEVAAGGSYGFEIDYDTSVPGAPASAPALYRLRGAGVGGGLPFSLTFPERDGPWNPFASPVVTTPAGFRGAASMGGWSVSLGVGLSELGVTLYPQAADWQAIPINQFETSGLSFGAGFSSLHGPFQLVTW